MKDTNILRDTKGIQELSRANFVVTFISLLNTNADGYEAAADKMIKAVEKEKGFVAVYSVRNEVGVGITVSYWSSLEAIAQWKADNAHTVIQKKGKNEWYDWYQLQVCEIVRSSDG